MQKLLIKGKYEFVSCFEDFVRLVGEHMGADAEVYLKNCPEEFSWSEAVKFDMENEKIADGYLHQIQDAVVIADRLCEIVRQAEINKVMKYRPFVSLLLRKTYELKKVLDY